MFEGDGSFIESLPGVIKTEKSNFHLEVTLKEDILPKDFLKEIMPAISITHFSVV